MLPYAVDEASYLVLPYAAVEAFFLVLPYAVNEASYLVLPYAIDEASFLVLCKLPSAFGSDLSNLVRTNAGLNNTYTPRYKKNISWISPNIWLDQDDYDRY